MKKAILAIIVSAFVVSSASLSAYIPKPAPQERANVHLLFIQGGEEIVVRQNPKNKDRWTLAIVDMDPSIAFYSESPRRVAGRASVEDFMEEWTEGNVGSPTTTVLAEYSHENATGTNQSRRVLLSNPRFHKKSNTMLYDVTPATGATELVSGRHNEPVLFVHRY